MSSRKEEKERLRREREERERAAASGARRRRRIGYGVGGVLVLAALVAIAVVALAGGGGSEDHRTPRGGPQPDADLPESPVPPQRETDFAKATKASGCVPRSERSEGRGHTTSPVKYRTNPPTSGKHNPNPPEDGAYGQSPGSERLVHALEHGRVIIQFRPSAPEKLRGQLKSLFDEDPYHVILTPNPTMPYEVAATAWTQMLGCEQANDQVFDAIRAFTQRYRDRGP